jgi:acyl-coenzyme A synthetase/AMP-(fatty) acid ligase
MLQAFLDKVESMPRHRLARVICSGEALTSALTQRFHERLPGVELYNLYGPTEAAVEVTSWHCAPGVDETIVPIGYPVANTRIYVLDERMEPVPVGVAGELHIGGVQVARGYLNRPELTAERFVASPFVEGDRLYKTGDLARYRADGAIEYLGRNDFQVKIRGLRIELGEIEARLLEHGDVREAVVVAREEEGGEKRLVAYYAPREGADLDARLLREHLLVALPEYMVPAAYVPLVALPLTSSGKIDRKALPAPESASYAAAAYEAPAGDVEERIAKIWCDVLRVDRVGRNDNFFALGGHSLLIIQVLGQLRESNMHADVASLFAARNLAAFAARVDAIEEIRL